MSRHDSERRPLLSRTSTTNDGDATSIKTQESPKISTPRAIAIGLSIFILIFILTCNVSLMTTIQSPIAEELNASSEVTWFNSSYLIAVTSLTPISGKLCQIFTPRVFLFASIIVQAIGILLTSQAHSTHVFLVGRAVCGIGSAAVTPVAFILVTKYSSLKKRGLFFGLINTGYTTGLATGAIVAGAIEPVLGWRAVFLLQVPVTFIAALVAFLLIPKEAKNDSDVSMARKLARIDYFGVFTLTTTLVLMLYTLSAHKIDFRALALSLGMLVLFVFIEVRWATEPIVPPSVMRSRANVFSGVSTVGVMTARWGILFYTPVYAIAVRGWKQSAAGALLIPTNAGFAVGGLLAGWLHIRRAGSFYTPTLICFGLFAIAQFFVSELITTDSAIWLYVTALFCNGFVTGGLLNYGLAHLLHLTHKSQHVIVIPFNATFRSFSGSFGSAIAGGYFLRSLDRNLHQGFKSIGMPHSDDLIRRLIGAPMLVQKLQGDEQTVAVDAYASAIRATFSAGVGLAVIMMIVQAGVGWTAPEEGEDSKASQSDRDGIQRVMSQEPVVS